MEIVTESLSKNAEEAKPKKKQVGKTRFMHQQQQDKNLGSDLCEVKCRKKLVLTNRVAVLVTLKIVGT